jgi:hypothetical protein
MPIDVKWSPSARLEEVAEVAQGRVVAADLERRRPVMITT